MFGRVAGLPDHLFLDGFIFIFSGALFTGFIYLLDKALDWYHGVNEEQEELFPNLPLVPYRSETPEKVEPIEEPIELIDVSEVGTAKMFSQAEVRRKALMEDIKKEKEKKKKKKCPVCGKMGVTKGTAKK